MEFLIKTKHCFSLLLYFLFAHSAGTDHSDSQLDSSVSKLIVQLLLPVIVYVVKTEFSVNIFLN